MPANATCPSLWSLHAFCTTSMRQGGAPANWGRAQLQQVMCLCFLKQRPVTWHCVRKMCWLTTSSASKMKIATMSHRMMIKSIKWTCALCGHFQWVQRVSEEEMLRLGKLGWGNVQSVAELCSQGCGRGEQREVVKAWAVWSCGGLWIWMEIVER